MTYLQKNPNVKFADFVFEATIIVPEGIYKLSTNIYNSPINVPLSYGLKIDKDITLQGAGKGKTIITGDMNAYNSSIILFTEYDGEATIDGFSFEGDDYITVIAPDAPYKSGYIFRGWSGNDDVYKVGDEIELGSNTTFRDRWTWIYEDDNEPLYNTGSSETRYSVSVKNTVNGSIDVSPLRTADGNTVTITVAPDNGYSLDTLTVTDADGYDVTVREISPTEYIFKMPASKVTVEAEFVKTPETSTLPYNDVDVDDWFYGAAEYAYNNGIMSGMGATQFAPNINLSRAMLAQILYNMESGTPVSSAQFADVVAGAWYADAVNWAAANGTVGGYGDGISGPEINISREQIAVILYRYASYKGYNVSTKDALFFVKIILFVIKV